MVNIARYLKYNIITIVYIYNISKYIILNILIITCIITKQYGALISRHITNIINDQVILIHTNYMILYDIISTIVVILI